MVHRWAKASLAHQIKRNNNRTMKLTLEQKRVKITECLGWKGCTDARCDYRKAQHLHKDGRVWFFENYTMPEVRIPNWFNDLNACHDIEKKLEGDEDIERYMDKLTDLCGGDTPKGTASFTAYFATAAQRAECFGITMQLWKEGE
jgi:hypothetical protein